VLIGTEKKKGTTFMGLVKIYCNGFRLLFTNASAVLILLGCCFRLWETATISFFQQKYFKVYQNEYALYSSIMAVASFVGGILANMVAGIIIDFFDKRSEMTIPMICTVKAALDIPFCIMTYLQHTNFWLSMTGILCQLVFAKGWTAPAILILKTVVDPSISNISVAMFLFFQNLVYTFSSATMGILSRDLDVDPVRNPTQYGKLISSMTVIPAALSIPFFLVSGYKMRQIKRAKIESGEMTKKQLEDDRMFIKQFTRMGTHEFENLVITQRPIQQNKVVFKKYVTFTDLHEPLQKQLTVKSDNIRQSRSAYVKAKGGSATKIDKL